MSRSISKIVAATLMIVFVFALFPGMKLKAATSGTCGNQGDNVKWTLDDDGTLTISGKGAMKNWSVDTSAPSPFQSNTSISKVVIENGVTTIGMGAFCRCTQLSEITIPNSVEIIGPESFSNCSALSSIIIPNSVSRIDQSAFYNCTSLTSITIPDKVSYISRSAFQGCTSLTSITIPNSVTSIYSYAFHRCTSLTSIIIPNSVTSIGNDAFKDCTSLTSITIRKSLYDNCKEAFPNISSDAFHFDAEITFKNYDDTVLESKKVAVGETPSYTGKVTPTKPSDGAYSYEFAGWDTAPVAVTGPATYIAVFNKKEIKKYEVTFKNYDDTVLESKKVKEGEIPSYTGNVIPTKPSDGVYSYEFAGWDTAPVAVTGPATYIAVYDKKEIEYEITFKNYDDTVLESKKVKAGETPSYTGTVTPTRPPDGRCYYQFAGWDPIPGAVTGPATYTAVYYMWVIKDDKYTVTFVDNDNVEIYSTTLYYRTAPIYTGKTPVKNETDSETFTFIGWTDGNKTYGLNEDLPRIEKDTIFKPVFRAEPKPVYTVGEVKGDGIKSDIVIDVHRNVDDENCLTYFLSATIDGTEMKINDQYTATKGSTIITIKKDFLSTLPAGEHEVQVVFNDGSISTKVTIAAKASVPSTGEVTGPATYIGLALIATACACGAGIILLKKRKDA